VFFVDFCTQFWLSPRPLQTIVWKDPSPKGLIMCQLGRKTILTCSVLHFLSTDSVLTAVSSVESHPAGVEDIAERARRVTRAEEQAVRSARTIYALSQQATQLQDDIGKAQLRSAVSSKKVIDISV